MKLINGDCYEELSKIQDNSIDLVIIDPPYKFVCGGGGGAFGMDKRKYHQEYIDLCKEETTTKVTAEGFRNDILDELCRVMKKINIYVWCSKQQLRQVIDYFDDRGCFIDFLTWHKTNPTPTCNNTYLSDTEYLVFAREKNVKIGGTYHTKKKYYVTPLNTADKRKYNHPTVKPLEIIENLIINSSQEGDVVLDCFMGSGTTGVACKNINREFIGIEIDEKYFETAKERIGEIGVE